MRVSRCRDRAAAAKADADVGSQRLMCRHLLWRTVGSISKGWLNPLRVKPLQPLAGGRRDGLLNWENAAKERHVPVLRLLLLLLLLTAVSFVALVAAAAAAHRK